MIGGHIETVRPKHLTSQSRVKANRQALEGVAKEDRCTCPHSLVEGKPGVYEVKQGVTEGKGDI